jgi:hypothetical protein
MADDGAEIPLPPRGAQPRTAIQRRQTVTAVIAWAEASGAPLHGVTARVDESGNVAMVATRDVAHGEQIFALPQRLMIIDRDIASSELASHAALAAWLASRDATSPWRAYLDDLPLHVSGLPLYRSARELAALAGTSAHALAVADRRDLLDAHASLRTPLPLAVFAWGWAVVRSRAYHAPGSFEPRLALMPIVDLFDHGHGDTTWTYDPADGFAITAERAIPAGDPVTFPYGDISNGRLLAHYGFTLPDDPFAEALLELDRPVLVTARIDPLFVDALAIARQQVGTEDRALALLADAARRTIATLAEAPSTGDPEWDACCTRLRMSERAVLEQYVALADREGPLYAAYRAALAD